jgi:hypothetical protein
VAELYSVFVDSNPTYNPQYPLLHYFAQAVLIGPFILWSLLTGQLVQPSPEYPFGFGDPVTALAVMTMLGRTVNLLMAAGVVVISYLTGKMLWGNRTGWYAGLIVLLLFPMFYYSRTSNLDMGALFWTSIGFAVFARCLRTSLNARRACWLGILAGAAIGTKDATYASFASFALVLVPLHFVKERRLGSTWGNTLKPLWIGFAASVVVYLFASGLVFDLDRYSRHLKFVSTATAAFVYPETLIGYLGLLRESAGHLLDALGLPVSVLSVVGVAVLLARRSSDLWLLLPALGIVVGTILPVHFVNFRYLLIVAYVGCLFAAFGLTQLMTSPMGTIRRLAGVALVAVLGWGLLRGADLTYQMTADSRYFVGEWLAPRLEAGDRIGHFGATPKLPPLPAGVVSVRSEQFCTVSDWKAGDPPEFVLTIPQQHFEKTHSWSFDDALFKGLTNGELGYREIVTYQTRSLFSKRVIPFVNPPTRVFVRHDRLESISDPQPIVHMEPAVLTGVEDYLGLSHRPLSGLQRNYTMTPDPCP